MIIESSAPSNIALIKYMGKLEGKGNIPTNSSLSWTLTHLRTFVNLTAIESGEDEWAPLQGNQLLPIVLSQKSRERYLRHFHHLKGKLKIEGSFLIQSANNFPADCGLASSASSFAALTKAAHELALYQGQSEMDVQDLAELSRQGSGSSIRSFFEPWVLWHSEGIRPLEFPIGKLQHQVVVVESEKKKVSSSEAHKRVFGSELFAGRSERAESRLAHLIQAFREEQWKDAFNICWAEFWDMHALFETCSPSFGYMEPGTIEILKKVRSFWQEHSDGPLVTMDAGANVHLLYRANQDSMAKELKTEFDQKWIVFASGKTPEPSTEKEKF